jgi:hypothetical protein
VAIYLLTSYFDADPFFQRLVPTPRRMHRGPKTGKVAKSKSVKQSARRVKEIFSSTSRPNIPHFPIGLPAQVAPSTLAQSEAILGWVSFSLFNRFSFNYCTLIDFPSFSFFFFDQKASAFSSAHPYISKEDRLQARRARLRRVPAQQQQDLPIQQVTYSCSFDF